MKTLSAAASASELGDADVRHGAPGRRRDVRVVALCGGTGLPVLLAPPHMRHDASKLARAVVDLAREGALR